MLAPIKKEVQKRTSFFYNLKDFNKDFSKFLQNCIAKDLGFW